MKRLAPLLLTLLLAGPAAARQAPPPAPAAPTTAVAALDRAAAAYEYGDMTLVVDATRPIVDGAIAADPAQRTQALRLLGIGLYLTGRPSGAEAAFAELLRLRPRARLDPTTTRPEVVAFFEEVRRRHAAELEDVARARSRRSFAYNLLPPLGQFKNGDTGRGWAILGVEALALATSVTTYAVLTAWHRDGDQYGPDGKYNDEARTLRVVNWVSVGLLAATYAYGVIDGIARSGQEPPDERQPAVSAVLLPGAAALSIRF